MFLQLVTVVDKLITVVVNKRGVISEFACTCKYCSFLLVIVNLVIIIQDCIYLVDIFFNVVIVIKTAGSNAIVV